MKNTVMSQNPVVRAAAAVLSIVSFAWAQGTPPAKRVKPDEVVATVEGQKITAGMIQRLRFGASQQFQQAALQNNKDFLKSVAGLLVLSDLAQKEKLEEQELYRDQLYFMRLNFLANAYLSNLNTKVKFSQEELQKYYADHAADYEEAVVRAIYVAFTRSPEAQAKGRLSQAQAKAKAEKLVKALAGGADFAKLAKENSDDATSAEKGGEISPVKRSSTGIPFEMRNAIFALKPGQVSDPIEQPAGYYVFRLEKIQTTPYEDVAASIATTVQGSKVQAEVSRILNSLNITYENEAFFAEQAPATPPASKP